MVKQTTLRLTRLRLSLLICVALLGVQATRAQHAFEYAARIGANALLYESDYGKPMPNYNVGMDFSYKYRSPYYIGARVGLGIDVAASTFVAGRAASNEQVIGTPPPGNDDVLADFDPFTYFPITRGGAFSDHYVVPRTYEPDGMQVNLGYSMERFTETQQLIIASVPVQLGVFVGNFSLFAGVRVGIPVHGCYWQRVKNTNMALYFPDTQVTIPNAGQFDPETGEATTVDRFDPNTQAGIATPDVKIKQLSKDTYPQYNIHLTVMADVNYSFQIGEKTDLSIGAYLEYDPIGYTPKMTSNTSLMEWHYSIDDHTNDPVFRRDYVSVLEANYANGAPMRQEGDMTGSQVVRAYHRASVGLRLSVSLWSVPLDFGKNYRKQQLYKVCMCDFF